MRNAALSLILVVLLVAGRAWGQSQEEFDRYGGWTRVRSAATGSFGVSEIDGRWAFFDPEGHHFLSLGVNSVSFRQDTIRGTKQSPYGEAVSAKYGRQTLWARSVAARLRGWGFNTLGAWSDQIAFRQGVPYTVILDLAHRIPWGEAQTFPDVFDSAFGQAAARLARRICRPLAGDPWLLGYFTDNELRWAPDARGEEPLAIEFLRLPDEAPGRQALVRFLGERYETLDRLNDAWRADYSSFDEVGRTPQVGSRIPESDQDGFLEEVAAQYFSVVEQAIRSADPHHLILGCRFAGEAPRPVLEAMADHVDVVSLNHYGEDPPLELLREIHEITGRPVIISEFSFRARDSGLPNSHGAGPIVDTQEERAERFEHYVRTLMAVPSVVGYHWFEHADQPAAGRFDGEDSNYGLVSIQDEPYVPLVETMTRVNLEIRAQLAPRPQDEY